MEAIYLTKSKIRRRLLGLLLSNLKKSYYLSELARLVDTSAGNVQRELAPLVRDELILREKRGSLTFYVPNPHHALFPELRSLILKTSGVEGRLRELVKRKKEILCAVLYGSFAKGTQRGESDIDILLIADKDLGGFYRELSELETLFGREINPTVYSLKEFKKKLREKHGFVVNLMKESCRTLKGNLRELQAEYP